MTKLTNQTILEFKLTEDGKNHVRDRLLYQRKLFESLLIESGDYPERSSITGESSKSINIENLEYQNMIKYIDELFERTNQEVMNMMFTDFLTIFPGIDSRYIIDADVTVLDNNDNNYIYTKHLT